MMRVSGCRAVASLLVLALGPVAAEAQLPRAGVVTAVQGQSLATRVALPQPILLKLKDDVFVRDRIETRENSLARILLGGKALVTIRELSIFTVTEEPGRAVVNLQAGKAALGVARSLIKPGEAIEVRTPNAIAAVRGSAVVVEVAEVEGVLETLVAALSVSVPVTVSFAATPSVVSTLMSNQFVVISRLGPATTSTPVQVLPPGLAARLAKVAEAPKTTRPGRLPDQAVNAMMEEAANLAESMGQTAALPDAAPSTSDLGVNANPCRNVGTGVCSPAAAPPPPPPPPPEAPSPAAPRPRGPGAPPPPVVVAPPPPPPATNPPPGFGGVPPGQQNTPPGHGGTVPGQSSPGSAFTPPGQGGATPFTPGHGGTPPGQRR
jgi:hypothetical protein